MKIPYPGAIDCDVHPAVPSAAALLPHLEPFWRDHVVMRDIHRLGFTMTSYPPTSPLSGRADWRPAQGLPGSDLDLLRTQALDGFGSRYAICNVLHGAVTLYTDDLRAALIRGINNWIARELLDREPRLRASIVVSPENPAQAVAEIERMAPDPRFVQVLLMVMGELPLGRRNYWPIYEAAERHDLTIGIHAGSTYRHAPTQMGWTSYQIEDYAAQAPAFDNTLLSLIAEGVFTKFPKLRVVLIELGFTWLPTFLWRTNKIWRGVRAEVPWLDRQPEDYVRDHVRFTLQPADLPPDPEAIARTMEHIGADDLLLFSSDYPHWQFDGDEILPDGLSETMIRKLLVDNPLAAYPRLNVPVAGGASPTTREEALP